jgi:hypothetical protein
MSIIQESLKKSQANYLEKKKSEPAPEKKPPEVVVEKKTPEAAVEKKPPVAAENKIPEPVPEKKIPRVVKVAKKKVNTPKLNLYREALYVLKPKKSVILPAVVTLSAISVVAFVVMVSLLLYRASPDNRKNVARPLPPKVEPIKPVVAKAIHQPVKAVQPKAEERQAPMPVVSHSSFVLSGIMYLDGKPQAIINGSILEEGDSINDATVVLIDRDYVLLNVKDSKVKLTIRN